MKFMPNKIMQAVQGGGYGRGRQRLTLPVKGMYCPSCVSKVEQALRAVPGVRKARVDLAAERATLAIDPQRVTVEEVEETVRDLGYEVPMHGPPGESTAEVPGRLEVLLRSRGRFLRFLESRMESQAEAEDLLQTAFLKAMTEGHADPDEERVVPWFYQVIRHLLVDHYRHRGAQDRARERVAAEMQQAGAGGETEVPGAVCTCVNEVIETLKPPDAELIRRVEIEGEPVRKVATELGITANSASVRLHRARHTLREALQAMCGACAEHGYG